MLYHIIVKLLHWVKPEEVVQALNVQPPTPEQDSAFTERYLAAGGVLPRQETRPYATALLSRKLRTYVDPWLQTGRHADNSESPWKRKLYGSFYRAVLEYLDKHPVCLSLSSTGGRMLSIAEPTVGLTGPGQLYQAQEEEARRLFAGLLLSEKKQTLCKCRYAHCGRYFLRAKPRPAYRHGTFCCRLHQMHAAAVPLTRKRRQGALEELIRLAAQQLIHWKVKTADWVNDAGRKDDLAKALSWQICRNPNLQVNRQEVRINWVTRHQLRIERQREQAAKAGMH